MKILLRYQVNLAILLTFLVIAVVFAIIVLPFQQRALESIVRYNEVLLQSIVDRDEERLANEIFEDRRRAITLRLDDMSKVEGIKSIAVFDSQGVLLVNSGEVPAIDLPQEEKPQFPAKAKVFQKWTEEGDMLVFVRVIEVAQERVGLIRISLSLAEIARQQQMSSRIFVGVLASILVVMLVLLNILMTRTVIRPIATLRDAMSRLKGGALGTQLQVERQDEIGELKNVFNSMSTDLATSYQHIESQNQELRESGKKLAEERERLAQMRIYLRNIFNSMPSILVTINEEGIIEEWNDAAARSIGVPLENTVGRLIWEVLPFMERYRDTIGEVLATKSPREFHRESLGIGKGEAYYNVSLYPLVANCLQGIVVRIEDITELEIKEQQLRHGQKMETIGTLAGGLAHDFNNILGGITGSLSLIRFKLEQDKGIDIDFLDTYLKIMEQAGGRASELMKQLMSITRRQEMALQPVDLNESISQVINITSSSIDKSIEVIHDKYPREAMVKADPAQLEQVLLNLMVNAAHAMTTMRPEGERHGGTLTVAIERLFADQTFSEMHVEAKAIAYWVMSIEDTGVGMEPRVMAKIFDPFFTTKGKGKGTGLGLAMAYNIVRQHGGFLEVDTQSGKGSTFRVFLPVWDVAPLEAMVAADDPIRGEGLVLVVDDEEMIRLTAEAMLQTCGYTVLLAEDGMQAVELFRRGHQEIVAVLLDMVMPKMSGRETYLALREIYPEVKVLLSSGFRQDERVEEVLSLGVRGFVQKPYALREMAAAIHQVIYG